QLDQENRPAVHRRHIDGTVERNRQARLQIESIQRVNEGDVVVVRWPRGAVRQRESDAAAGQLGGVGDGEAVTWEWAAVGGVQVECSESARHAAIFQDFKAWAPGSVARSHGENSSQIEMVCVTLRGSPIPARRPSAGAVPSRWGACLAVRTPPAACFYR